MNKNDFIFSLKELCQYLIKKSIDLKRANISADLIPISTDFLVSKYYLDLIDWDNLNDPLRKMVIPDRLETCVKDYELTDPIGDEIHSPVPGIIHRYPDRCLLNLVNTCATRCRFCIRKNLLSRSSADFGRCLEYLKIHPEIWEVILSGGDPLVLTDNYLKTIILRLKRIKHVKVIRFHTRVPVVYPKRITPNLVYVIKGASPLTVVIHINHAQEITDSFIKAVNLLKQTGAILLSQTVLLKDVNNNAATLTKLFKRLVEIGIKPYFLHHPDLVKGTHRFRIALEEGKSLLKKLRGNISGVCLPEYVVDLPGGFGKIPVFHLKKKAKRVYEAINYKNKKIKYIDYIS